MRKVIKANKENKETNKSKRQIKAATEEDIEQAEQYLTDYEIATPEEVDLVEKINGTTYETLCDILYVRTGYRDFTQIDEYNEEYADEEIDEYAYEY